MVTYKEYVREQKIQERKKAIRGFVKGFVKVPTAKDKGGKVITQVTREKAFARKLKGGKKAARRRGVGAERLLKAMGVIAGKSQRAGAGRPRGSYKYQLGGRAVSVFEWRRAQAQRKRLYALYQQQQYQRMGSQGFTPEQVRELQQQQIMQQPRQVQPYQQQVQPQEQIPIMEKSIPDQELDFHRFASTTQVTPNTQRILDNIRRIQLKGQRDEITMQRRLRERQLVRKSMSMFKAHENMNKIRLDPTGVSEDNILKAPNIFAEKEDNPHILKPRRFNLLQTKEAGNSLWF